MIDDLTEDELLALLDWQRAMGADAALGVAPVDWLARGPLAPGGAFEWPERAHAGGAQPPSASLQGAGPTAPKAVAHAPNTRAPAPPHQAAIVLPGRVDVRAQTPLAPSAAETDARRVAHAARSLAALEAALRGFEGCGLKATAKNLCFYRGAPQARLMVIGEAPGREEDIEGKPFVGRAGQLLDKMLAAIGITEASVHITNVVYWRPPGNRTPTPQETLACRPFLERQMELVAPDIVVALGGAAAKEVLDVAEGIMRLRGKWREIDVAGRKVRAVATLHPAYLLRTPAAKQLAWADLLALKARLSEP